MGRQTEAQETCRKTGAGYFDLKFKSDRKNLSFTHDFLKNILIQARLAPQKAANIASFVGKLLEKRIIDKNKKGEPMSIAVFSDLSSLKIKITNLFTRLNSTDIKQINREISGDKNREFSGIIDLEIRANIITVNLEP